MRKIFLALFLLLTLSVFAEAQCGTSLCVQIKDAENAGADDTLDVVMTSNVTAGNTLVLSIWFCDGAGCNNGVVDAFTIAVSDTLAHTYTEAIRFNYDAQHVAGGNDDVLAIYYVCNISGGANTTTVTITPGGGGTTNYLWASVTEYSGIADASCLDQTGSDAGNSGTVTINTDGATSQATELVHGIAAGATDLAGTSTVLSTSGNGSITDQYKTVVATGVQSLVWNQTSQTWEGIIATFKEVVVGGSAKNRTLLGVGP